MDFVGRARDAAFRAGLKPAEFWTLTPYESMLWCRAVAERDGADYKRTLAGAWYSAAFTRQKKLPKLAKIMGDDPKPQTAETLKRKAKALAAVFGGQWRG